MASQAEISIPSIQTATTVTPYIQYNVSLRLPLRSFILSKRYSDFVTLHVALTQEASAPPPTILPPKSYLPFASTATSSARIESRRLGLESYLRTLSSHADARWRTTSAWRTFLNLPRTPSSASLAARSAITAPNALSIPTDPTLWLDVHRDAKSQLHDARQHLTQRAQHVNSSSTSQTTAPAAREAAAAKACLVRAGSLITALARALEPGAARGDDGWGSARLGEGEVRRRGDLVAAARNELAALEMLAGAMTAKGKADATVAERSALVGGGGADLRTTSTGHKKAGRILGGETARTRELDNNGVVGLQQQMMREQDEDVQVLAQAVRRQKELAEQINGELVVQNELLALADEDVTRVAGKLAVARKRINKIS